MSASNFRDVSPSCCSVLRLHELAEKIGLRRSSVYNKLNPRHSGFDASFPSPVRLGARSVGWLDEEVEAWVASRAQERDEKGGVK